MNLGLQLKQTVLNKQAELVSKYAGMCMGDIIERCKARAAQGKPVLNIDLYALLAKYVAGDDEFNNDYMVSIRELVINQLLALGINTTEGSNYMNEERFMAINICIRLI